MLLRASQTLWVLNVINNLGASTLVRYTLCLVLALSSGRNMDLMCAISWRTGGGIEHVTATLWQINCTMRVQRKCFREKSHIVVVVENSIPLFQWFHSYRHTAHLALPPLWNGIFHNFIALHKTSVCECTIKCTK